MSQDYSNNKRARRAARAQRNKPTLITSAEGEQVNGTAEYTTTNVGTATQTIDEPKALVVPTSEPVEQPVRRLPRFFSTVKKSEAEGEQKEAKEAEVVQARVARATRGKAVTEVQTTRTIPVESKKAAVTTPAKPVAAKPKGLFKTRHIIGMAVYLLAADFLGLYEQRFLSYLGLEKELTKLSLFGGTLHVMTSTIVFLASLVIILVLLARFDLIPRSLGGASRTQRGTGQTAAKSNGTTGTQGERVMPPTMRQGVKGSDDTLYQQYRSNQRKKK